MRKTRLTITAGLIAGATALLPLATANAAPATPAAVVGSHFSKFLAGYAGEGNGLSQFTEIRAQIIFPPENSSVPADQVAGGVALSQYVNGGRVEGAGGVWDDPAGCGPGLWTIEAGTQINATGSPAPVSTANLHPLNNGFGFICLPSGQEAVEVYFSTTAHEVMYLAGPNYSTVDVLGVQFGVFNRFRDPAIGVTTTSGAAAATLTLGTLLNVQSAAFLRNTVDTLFDAANLASYTGTVTGGAPSVANPVTLGPPSAFGPHAHFVIAVP